MRPLKQRIQRIVWMSFLLMTVVGIQGCYHYRVVPPNPDPATEFERRTVHAFAWGLVQEDVRAVDCVSNALDEVRVTTNMAYLVASVVSLGTWVPVQVEWRCAKKPSPDGDL